MSMSRNKSKSNFDFNQAVKKFFLSAFVILAFIAYAIHERLTNSSSASAAPNAGTSQDTSNSSANAPVSNSSSNSSASSSSSSQPAAASGSASSNSGTHKDGTYTGQSVDVNYGLVQVQATIQNGQIAQVQFLQFPQ